jgi:hypothetical protein
LRWWVGGWDIIEEVKEVRGFEGEVGEFFEFTW